MASSSKKNSKSKKAESTSEDVVDAVVIEESAADAAQEMETVDEMADADGVTQDLADDAPLEDAASDSTSTDDASDEEAVVEDVEADEPSDIPAEAPVPVPAPAQPAERSNSFWGLVLGGLIAAGLGFLWSQYLQPENDGALEAELAAQSKTIETLQARSDTLDGQLAEQLDQITGLEAKIAELTAEVNKPITVATEAELSAELAALIEQQKNELASLQEDLKSMAAFAEGQIASAQEEVEAAARAEARAKARDNLNVVRLALASGDAFGDALPKIAEAVEVPDALSAVAAGVPTQAQLQEGFGPAARAALAAANRELAGDSAGDRVGLFLQDMIGARSLTPQEGDSPDAVLSRVEAAVKSGDLAGALTTLDALPEGGKAELTEWSGMAKARSDALQAFSDLTDALSAD